MPTDRDLVRLRAGGPAAPSLAWERYARPALWSTWAPHIVRVEADGDRIRPGMRGRVVALGGIAARFEVDAVDEARMRWVWTVRSGPVRMRLEHAVLGARRAADGAGGSVTTLAIDGPRLVAVAYAPVAGWALRRLVR